MGYRDYSVAKGHIVDATGHGDFTTLTAALAAASSGEDIFIRPGTYTEDVTLKAGVNITGFPGDEEGGNVLLIGKMSFSAAGVVNVSNIAVETNGDYVLEITGSAASEVTLRNVRGDFTDNTGISYTSSSSSSGLDLLECTFDVTTTGITHFVLSGAGRTFFEDSRCQNSGGSSTASTCSSGQLATASSGFGIPISVSGTTLGTWNFSNFTGSNVTAMTVNIAGAINATRCFFAGGTATALVITAGILSTRELTINSSNANAISGGGELQYNLITYTGSSSTNSVTTQAQLTTQPSLSGGGIMVQQVRNFFTAMTQYTSIPNIPRDTTVPQNTEGSQVATISITPTNASNVLWIQANFTGAVSSTVTNNLQICLFQDATAGALETQTYDLRAAAQEGCVYFYFSYLMTAGTTSSTTFNFRMGGQNLNTLTVNGISNTALYGGTMGSSITVTEIAV